MAQELVAVGVHLHGRARLELCEWRGGGVDFIAEDPQVAGAQAPVFAALEFEDGDGHRGAILPAYGSALANNMSRTGWPRKPAPTCGSTRRNPVDWYPWGQEALELARSSGKPILLSIGYSACHWCHVMAHESFEDAATAALMNELFVNIKVDREERPDIDKIYQFAHQVLTQRGGGWPLTMFLTHDDQKPFFGGTYFPDKARYGMPAFSDAAQARVRVLPRAARRAARAERHAAWTCSAISRPRPPMPT